MQTNRRLKRLFTDDPLRDRLTPTARDVLAWSVADLVGEASGRTRGGGLPRPAVRGGSAVADPTPTLASLAFSRSVATQRLRLLEADLGVNASTRRWTYLACRWIGSAAGAAGHRLADAARCAGDFGLPHAAGRRARAARLFNFGEFADRLAGESFWCGRRAGRACCL
ncbi:MAG: hypothetical protein U0797_12005 [Gemmataceae bacterium]